MLIDDVLQAGPVRVAIGDADLLYAGQIDHADVEVPGMQRRRLRRSIRRSRASPAKRNWKPEPFDCGCMVHLFPFRGALVAGVEADFVGLDADRARR